MPTVAVLNMQGQEVGQQQLSDAVFGIEPNVSVMNDMVKNYLANQRQGTQSALTRSEVSGGGKKPWRQKGTGHARQGSTRAFSRYHISRGIGSCSNSSIAFSLYSIHTPDLGPDARISLYPIPLPDAREGGIL